MTEKQRREIAKQYRKLLDRGILRKAAIAEICSCRGVSRRSLYRWCRDFNVSTK